MERAQGKLDIMREQRAAAADPVLERKCLSLKLDSILAGNLRPHVQLRRLLHFRMPELEDDLRIANWKTVFISDAPSQDEGIVVETEVLGVEEYHLSYSWC